MGYSNKNKNRNKNKYNKNANNSHGNNIMLVKRGEIYFADLGDDVKGSEQKGTRPVLILQNDIGNKHSTTTIIALITTMNKRFPMHYFIEKEKSKLPEDSTILLEQIRTIDKVRLLSKISKLENETMEEINNTLKISLGIS